MPHEIATATIAATNTSMRAPCPNASMRRVWSNGARAPSWKAAAAKMMAAASAITVAAAESRRAGSSGRKIAGHEQHRGGAEQDDLGADGRERDGDRVDHSRCTLAATWNATCELVIRRITPYG